MNTRLVLLVALGAAINVLPASARPAPVSGVVVARDAARGTVVLAAPDGVTTTVQARLSRIRLGDRIVVARPRLVRGDVTGVARVVGHARRATVRGVVVRELGRRTLVSTGGSVISIRRAGAARRLAFVQHAPDLRPGDIARFDVEISPAGLTQTGVVTTGAASTVRVEGTVVSASPLVVSVQGLPLAIAVPAGTVLPAGVMPGARIELNVSVGAANVFTLVAVDEVEAAGVDDEVDEDEVEVKGAVVSSSPGQLVVAAGGRTFAFVPPVGVTLPTLPTGTIVEVKGRRQQEQLVLVRLRVEDEHEDDHGSTGRGGDDDHGGPGTGGDDGGGGSGHGGDDD